MGLFSSSKSSATSTTQTTTNTDIENRQKSGTVGAEGGSKAYQINAESVEMLDEGAIERAFNLAEKSAAVQSDTLQSALNGAMSEVGKAYQSSNQVGQPLDINQAIKWAGGAVAAIALVLAMRKGGRK